MSTEEKANPNRNRAWHVLSSQRLLDATPWLEVWRETVEVPDGRIVDDYHLIRMPDFAIAVAFTRDGEVIAERQYRHGVGRVVLDLPAGKIEPDEDPMEAAKRELLEETGYGGGSWCSLGAFALSDSRIPVSAHLFLAEGVEPLASPTSDDLEEVEVLLLAPGQLMVAIATGEVGDVCAVSAFLLAQSARANSSQEPPAGGDHWCGQRAPSPPRSGSYTGD